MVTLSVVIVTWNAKKYVEECLTSLVNSHGAVVTEICVVDNGSSDGTQDLIRAEFPMVRLVETGTNLGFAKANNIGMRLSSGKYVCLINSDVVLPPDCLVKMCSYMEQNPTIGMLGPRMSTPEGPVGRSYMRYPTVWRCFCRAFALDGLLKGLAGSGGIEMKDFDNSSTAEVEVLNGWFLMARRTAIEAVGLLDERFFMYGEDIDWSYRFQKAGWRRVYFAGAEALHYGGASSAAAPIRFYIAMQVSNLQFWRKHHGHVETLAYLLALWLHEICRVAGYSAVFVFKTSARANAAAKLKRSISCLAWLCGMRRAEGVTS
jgi:GT2 family glycosyltransferase